MKHHQLICTCDGYNCMFCAGGLFACEVCHTLEGAVPTHCPGAPIDEFTQMLVYQGKLDFLNGNWVRQPSDVWYWPDVWAELSKAYQDVTDESLPLGVELATIANVIGSMTYAKIIRRW